MNQSKPNPNINIVDDSSNPYKNADLRKFGGRPGSEKSKIAKSVNSYYSSKEYQTLKRIRE